MHLYDIMYLTNHNNYTELHMYMHCTRFYSFTKETTSRRVATKCTIMITTFMAMSTHACTARLLVVSFVKEFERRLELNDDDVEMLRAK